MTRMSHSWMWAVVATILAMGGGCAHRRMAQTQQATAEHARHLSDAEVADVIKTANQAEVQQGQLAMNKARNPAVRAYAMQMVEQHQEAVQRNEQLCSQLAIVPAHSDVSTQIVREGGESMDRLNRASGDEFDRKYVQTQISEHEELLRLIDNVLLPSTQDPRLRAELMQTRPLVERHLEHARELERNL